MEFVPRSCGTLWEARMKKSLARGSLLATAVGMLFLSNTALPEREGGVLVRAPRESGTKVNRRASTSARIL
jgi:hypothetical protein